LERGGKHWARMAPKIQAIVWYLEAGGKQVIITNPENIGRALQGKTGGLDCALSGSI
jgi:carbamate kinase